MKLLDVTGAQHFCRTTGLTQPPVIPKPTVRAYYRGQSRVISPINEGTPAFEAHRALALQDAERYIFMACSQYRRSFDLLSAHAAPWAHVSLYYGAFFAANALVAIFGGLIDVPNMIIEAQHSNPGTQSLTVRRRVRRSPSGFRSGSHRIFWDYFYDGASSLIPWVDASLQFSLKPVTASRTWQIDQRNEVNYDPFTAVDLSARFTSSFDPLRCRATLTGALATQLDVTEGLLFVAVAFANDFGLASNALRSLGSGGARRDVIRDHVLRPRTTDVSAQFDLGRLTA